MPLAETANLRHTKYFVSETISISTFTDWPGTGAFISVHEEKKNRPEVGKRRERARTAMPTEKDRSVILSAQCFALGIKPFSCVLGVLGVPGVSQPVLFFGILI